ncbi:complement component C1q receptor [Micropterus dolomieu]|uniref:complement component C1q receptor n=1 Tax=Micropterus dolomieu TaxID=147949 RepID=UPI001E8EE145|nr:complement component C1q receptor [Micropterus dolomieu]
MLLIFLLQLINSFEGLSRAKHETLCTSNACFTLHMNRVSFGDARQSCVDNGGYLMTVRDREEEDVLRSLLSHIERQHHDRALKFWIGLKLHSGDCVLHDKNLKGFKWVSGEEDSHYSNWGKEPDATCTAERCVHYTLSGQNQLNWIDGPCKRQFFYACKFYFKGMCKPLALLGPGQITYIAPFSDEPQRSEMQSFPLGTYAEIECSDKAPKYSVCNRIGDIYRWSVPGPFCNTGKQNCTINNGSGDTCEHQCVMGESGYSCTCPDGFKLDANQRSCSDTDECQSQVCGHHFCYNTPGSYTCECIDGYEMVDGKCSDMDECVQSRCEHSCLNSIGSFSCYCNKGFNLSEDGHSCVDINECVSNHCQFNCVNTLGSFLCTCPQGFHMETNGSSCAPDMKETAVSSDGPAEEETQENLTESLTRTTVELQHQSPHTEAPLPQLVNVTHGNPQSNTSLVTSFVSTVNSRVIICVLGSVIPLLLLVAVTLAIAIFRCSRSKKEAKKNTSTDRYCWVSSGLDPRLEKLYESILTDEP